MQQRALAHYNNLVLALMATTAQDRGTSGLIGKVSSCLVSIFAQADMLGGLDAIKTAL